MATVVVAVSVMGGPVTPDFDQIAQRICISVHGVVNGGPKIEAERQQLTRDVAEQLRLVWNARGAADLAAIELLELTQEPSMKGINRAIRELDR